MKKYFRLLAIVLLAGYLGIYQGHLALWYDASDTPARIFTQTADMYPPEDQAHLRQGIPFSDNAELEQLMEDYLS